MAAYRLFISLRSPFARRVRLALLGQGIPFDAEVIDVFQPTEPFLKANPLGLVPVLLTDSGACLPDSASILEFVDETHGGKVWPAEPAARLRARAASTLAEGVMTATVAHFLETQRKTPDPAWLDEHLETIHRTLAAIHAEDLSAPPWQGGARPPQAGLDLAVALDYLDLRTPSLDWRAKYPRLLPVLEACRGLPEFSPTAPPRA